MEVMEEGLEVDTHTIHGTESGERRRGGRGAQGEGREEGRGEGRVRGREGRGEEGKKGSS